MTWAQTIDETTGAWRRSIVVYHNPNTAERWLVALVAGFEVQQFIESALGQGCQVVTANPEKGDWDSVEWLRRYAKDAPLEDICRRLVDLGTVNTTARITAALSRRGAAAHL